MFAMCCRSLRDERDEDGALDGYCSAVHVPWCPARTALAQLIKLWGDVCGAEVRRCVGRVCGAEVRRWLGRV